MGHCSTRWRHGTRQNATCLPRVARLRRNKKTRYTRRPSRKLRVFSMRSTAWGRAPMPCSPISMITCCVFTGKNQAPCPAHANSCGRSPMPACHASSCLRVPGVTSKRGCAERGSSIVSKTWSRPMKWACRNRISKSTSVRWIFSGQNASRHGPSTMHLTPSPSCPISG